MRLFVVIVSFNSEGEWLKSLSKLKEKPEVIVVDNSKRNLGFAKGANKGIKQALKKGASHILLLNPDTRFSPNFLRPLLESRADIIGPVLKFKRTGRWVFDLGGYVNLRLGRPKHKEAYRLSTRPQKPDYVSGACMLVKREVFEKIGLFDERFFLYFEDVDFCLRAKRAGFSVAVEPASVVIHNLAEGKKRSFFKNLNLLKSNFIFIRKHVSPPFWPLSLFYWLLLSAKMLVNRVI